MADELPADALSRNGQVAMIDPDGNAGTIPTERVKEAIAAGYRMERPEEYGERYNEATYGNSPIKAGLEGAARTATFGLSDLILTDKSLGGVSPEALAQRRERNKAAAIVGEIGGGLLPIGAGGLLADAGRGAERLVAGAVGGKVLPAVARFATEGAGYGFGQGVSEVALSEHPMSAEAIVSTLGSNALFGAGGGAVLGGLSVPLRAAASEASGALRSVAGRAEGKGAADVLAESLAKAGNAETEGMSSAALAAQRTDIKEATAALRVETRALNAASQKAIEDLQPLVKAGIATDAQEAVLKDLRASAGKVAGLAELGDRGLQEQIARQPTKIAALIEDHRQQVVKAFGVMGQEAPETAALGSRLAEVGKMPAATITPAVESAIMPEKEGMLSRLLDWGKEKLSDKIPETLADKAGEAISEGAPRAVGDLIGGKAKVAVHMVTQTVLGAMGLGPAAHLVGAFAAEHALGRGLQGTVAKMVGKVAEGLDGFMAAGKVASRVAPAVPISVLRTVRYGADPVMEATPAPAATSKPPSDVAAFRARADELRAAIANPQRTQQDLHQRLMGVRSVDPVLADQVERAALDRITFLASKLPQNPGIYSVGTADRWQPSDTDLHTFARYAAAAEHPERLLEEMKGGRLTPETVETVKTLYPTMFKAVQGELMSRVTDLKQGLSYDQRLTLSVLFEAPLDSTMRPEFIAASQAVFAPEQNQKMNMGSASPKLPSATAGQKQSG